MSQFRFALSLVAALTLLLISMTARSEHPDSGAQALVQDTLHAEVAGSLHDRASKIQDALLADPSSQDANWQSGRLHRNGTWVEFETVWHELKNEPALVEYRQLRDAAPATQQGQIELADWCRANHLPDRERAHLHAAIELAKNPEDPALRLRLGLKQIDGAWMSDHEIRAEKARNAEFQRNLQAWRPRVQRLSEKFDGRTDKARAQARTELEAIDDPAALPALEAVLTDGGMEKSLLLAELLGRFKTVKAAAPLSRLAIQSQWHVVREQAAAQLKKRPIGSYVPELLESLRTPIDSNINLFVGANGVHLQAQLSSETERTVQQHERRYSVLVKKAKIASIRLSRDSSIGGYEERGRNRLDRAFEQANIVATQEADATELEVERRNSEIESWNVRVCAALADATGVKLPPDPKQWWEWWRDYNQLSKVEKNREYTYSRQATIVTAVELYEETAVEPLPPPQRPPSCLVAGTPVCTDRGMVPIDTVKVGDLVLSQHPESGELAYQPVLRTTVRDPRPIVNITTDSGTIRATAGHNFWISGVGWTRACDIKPRQRLHGARQPATVQAVATDSNEKTYNLVVADFHTYFVGEEFVLGHDLTFARPIDATVPGMKVE